MRKRKYSEAAPSPAPAADRAIGPLCTISAGDVYDVGGAQRALRLTKSTIRREVREGRLRVCKRAGRYYITGEQLLAWLHSGELPVTKPGLNGHAQPTASEN